MKKWIYMISLFFLFPIITQASTNTYPRTQEDLRIPSEVTVTEYNKNDILRTPSVDEKEKIYDFGELIDDTKEEEIYFKITEFIEKYDIDLFFVTTNEDTLKIPKNYLDDFFEYNFFGLGTSRDGIGFYIDLYNREVTTTTSGKAILYYDDERLDHMLDLLTTEDGFEKGIDSVIKILADYMEEGIPKSNENVTIDREGNIIEIRKVNWPISIIVALIVASIATGVTISGYKQIKNKTNANDYVDKNSIKFYLPIDTFVHTYTTRTPRIQDTGNSSNNSTGSTTHHGGGGRTFGGSSKKF